MTKHFTLPQCQMDAWQACIETMGADVPAIFLEIARWGANHELEACCEYLVRRAQWEPEDVDELRAARRLKPTSLKEQAMRVLLESGYTLDGRMELEPEDIDIIHRALEQLND